MSKMKKFFKGLGVISVPALCVYAIVGAVVVPLLIFETGASKEYNNTARVRSENHWDASFADPDLAKDPLDDHFKFTEAKATDGSNLTFKVDNKDTKIWQLTEADGTTVVNANSNKLMVFTHGLNSTHWNAMETAFYWSALGYRVISWDQRGGGDNRDSHITFGYSEADDLNNLYTAITNNKKELTGTFNKIDDAIIYGQSNGAATVISFADRFQTQIKNSGINTKFIEESGYTSPKRQFQTALNLHGIMPAAVVPLTIPMYELYAERNLSDADADYLAQSDKIKQPLFIVHGDEDPIVDFQMGVDLYKKMEANKGTKPENNAEPSIYIGKGLKHIGVSRASKINTTSAELNGVKKLLSELTKTADKARADALWTAFKANKNVVGYPDAVRFFYHMYMWDRFGTPFKELGGHDA